METVTTGASALEVSDSCRRAGPDAVDVAGADVLIITGWGAAVYTVRVQSMLASMTVVLVYKLLVEVRITVTTGRTSVTVTTTVLVVGSGSSSSPSSPSS